MAERGETERLEGAEGPSEAKRKQPKKKTLADELEDSKVIDL